jgi:apolipoprotein N-acyltransferase
VSGGQFINTAYVIDPTGQVVFRQGKSVPIQFFKDGLPAPTQAVWDSPWGKLGICICYDLSYRRVVEGLVRRGARAIIVPTMDVADWGEYQHRLHARIGPAPAKEFGMPVIRLASSGISQWIDASGRLKASAPFPGPEATLYGVFDLRGPTRVPLDIWLGPVAVVITTGLFLVCGFSAWTPQGLSRRRHVENKPAEPASRPSA